jgi:3-oxoacyl-[acyl-carrier protein] reductase
MGRLEGKIAIVSGSSRGIGRSIAERLLGDGATVYITGRDSDRLNTTFNELSSQYRGKVFKFRGDLSQTSEIINCIEHVLKNHKRIDITVANIGSGRSVSGWDIKDETWEESFLINFYPAVKLARESIRQMVKQQSGIIIFISSIAGCETIDAPVPYSTAKAALLAYMKNTANIVGSQNIRLNAVSPGNIYFKDGTWDKKMQEDSKRVKEYIRQSVPLNRFGTPNDVAQAVSFLCSEEASFISGANIIVDGGQTRSL